MESPAQYYVDYSVVDLGVVYTTLHCSTLHYTTVQYGILSTWVGTLG